MADFRTSFLTAYTRAKTANPELTKAKYMRSAFPQSNYKNDASARRAFNKIATGEATGKRRVAQTRYYGPKGEYKPAAGGLEGLWKVNVIFDCIDPNTGDNRSRSFIAYSTEYVSLLDKPYVEAAIVEATQERLEEWQVQYESELEGCEVLYVEPFLIGQTQIPEEHTVNIDSIYI